MNYWLLCVSPANFEATKRLGLTVQGFGARHRRKVQRMQPGDRLVYYLKGKRVFAAAATVASSAFEDATPVWEPEGAETEFRHRVQLRPDVVLSDGDALDARQIGPRMDYTRRWPPERWHLALQGELHLLSRADYELLVNEMRRSGERHPAAARPVQGVVPGAAEAGEASTLDIAS
ncbi:MAG: EVE domain-containing protein [Chloroflexi bacterium]|nr:EVE domain-containing protein [Chloroflexota bacterium]